MDNLEELLKEVLTDRHVYLRYSSYYNEWELSVHIDDFCTETLGRDYNLYELLLSEKERIIEYRNKNNESN